MKKLFLLVLSVLSVPAFCVIREDAAKYWDFSKLTKAPAYTDAKFPESQYPGLRAILFDGATYKGKPTKVFAYIGMPKGPAPKGGFPGIVLLHGGGGTAYGWGVELWNSYGYAVITIDWYNQRPADKNGKARIPLDGGKRKNNCTEDFQCTVTNAVLAHSLLRSLPQVNPDKIGFVGLSWGSWYGSTIAAVDPRFRCIINIYCGDLKPDNVLKHRSLVNGHFLHAAKVPMYWVAGTNDQNATPRTLQAGFDECAKLWNKSMVIELPHSHVGYRFKVCRRVADHFLKGGPELPKLGKNEFKNGVLSAPLLKQGKGIKKAILCYTCDRDNPKKTHLRKWNSIPATVANGEVSAKLPDKTFQCFLSVYDELPDNLYCCASGDLFERP